MPLRSPNNTATDSVIMQAAANIAVGYPSVNTVVGGVAAGPDGFGPVYIQREYELFRGNFPALLIWSGKQSYRRSSSRGYQGRLDLDLDYYDRYDQQPNQLDVIRANIATDLERVKANIESNPLLAQSNTAYTVDAFDFTLSDYAGILRDANGMQFVYRRLSVSFWILPYDA